jgi:hypothetical protein
MILILIKVIKYFLLSIFVIILIALIFQYVINTKYTFPEPHAFKGEFWYNPYKGMDSTKWKLANFHSHDRTFFENEKLTNKSILYLDSLYRYFGYSIITISDYQYINQYEKKNKWFVPVYEHGFQYYKNHQLVLNAKKTNWQDFPFRQTLSNKQFIIDQLKKDTASIITITHPIYRNAYSLNDFKYLSNYNSLEIANHERLFTSCYDTILSEGHPVFVMADDDAHDMTNIKEICSSFNIINTDMASDSIINSLRTGKSFGVKFNISSFKTNEEKKASLQKLPEINSFTLKNDTLTVSLNKAVKAIRFIGQKGSEKKRIINCTSGSYPIRREDTYIRTEILCNDGTIYFLNPVFRYAGVRFADYTPSNNAVKTWAWRSTVFIILIFTILLWNYKKVYV